MNRFTESAYEPISGPHAATLTAVAHRRPRSHDMLDDDRFCGLRPLDLAAAAWRACDTEAGSVASAASKGMLRVTGGRVVAGVRAIVSQGEPLTFATGATAALKEMAAKEETRWHTPTWDAGDLSAAVSAVAAIAADLQSFVVCEDPAVAPPGYTCIETPGCPQSLLGDPDCLPGDAIELFIGEDPVEAPDLPSLLAERWVELVGQPFLPYDINARRDIARRAPEAFQAMVRRHKPDFFG